MSETVELEISGGSYAVDAAIGRTLVEVLRDELGLTGTKVACGEGHCGACTVLVDGIPTLSCITLAHRVDGPVTTIEGLRDHPLVEAFVRADALQCGFCTPGILMSLERFIASDAALDEAAVREALAGNVCRCTGYLAIVEAVQLAARRIRGGGGDDI